MNVTRTTLRINSSLKRAAERQAAEEETTLQSVFNDALEQYLENKAVAKAAKIAFHTHDIGEPLDTLRRGDFYPEL